MIFTPHSPPFLFAGRGPYCYVRPRPFSLSLSLFIRSQCSSCFSSFIQALSSSLSTLTDPIWSFSRRYLEAHGERTRHSTACNGATKGGEKQGGRRQQNVGSVQRARQAASSLARCARAVLKKKRSAAHSKKAAPVLNTSSRSDTLLLSYRIAAVQLRS